MKRIALLPVVVLFLLPSAAAADAVLLKNGSLLQGKVRECNDPAVVLDRPDRPPLKVPRGRIALVCIDEQYDSYTRYKLPFADPVEGLQIATTLFRHPRTKKIVTLVGAIHVGDESYYRELQTVLKAHDRVLYELVTKTEDSNEPFLDFLARFYLTLKDLLQLKSQKEMIGYSDLPPNWVHADLPWPRIQRKLKARGLKMMSEDHLAIAQQLEGILSRYTETLEASGDAGRVAWMLKGMLGRLLGSDVEALLEMFRTKNPNDPVVGAMNLMVEMRNEHAMRVLKHELRRRHRSFAVFYGAAHMGYFEEQLQKMGFEPMGVCWLTAWTVQLRGVEQPP